jgi:para-aminobenzoate synthetase/4-amino-4-deoxychorismate lyase
MHPSGPDLNCAPPGEILRRLSRAGTPFVLLEQPAKTTAFLYQDPLEIVATNSPDQVRECLNRLRGTSRHIAGFMGYEAGHVFEPTLAPLRRSMGADEPPLLWFGLFDRRDEVELGHLLPDPASAWAGTPRPLVAAQDHQNAIERAIRHIYAGDIYQANVTFQAEANTAGVPQAVYAALRQRSQAAWSAMVFTGEHWILSFSPELFFTLEAGLITARPMKGTAPRDASPDSLRNDPKQQAENVMIVDLMRNDLSRLSKTGTVEVPRLFEVEIYPTLLQMTSTVVGEISEGLGAVDILGTIFPCGSITGAPKIRATELIDGFERGPRGVYTGTIGRIDPDGDAAFNVAIRTLVLRAGASVARLGLGSGIVADSVPVDEWRECLAKGAFVRTTRSFDLIETMRFDPSQGVPRLERHLSRMQGSAAALDFPFDRTKLREALMAATAPLSAQSRLRLKLSRSGAIATEVRPFAPGAASMLVGLTALPVSPDDFRLRHKTSDRAFYDNARLESGCDEVIFIDPDGFLTEGSVTSLFVERDGILLTPPLTRGLLPGLLREELIAEGRAHECDLVEDDLTAGFLLGNSVRGLFRASLVGR